jgi:hypothetical protein
MESVRSLVEANIVLHVQVLVTYQYIIRAQVSGNSQSIRPPLTNSQYSSRIYQLQARIKQIERHHIGGTSANKEKEELKDDIFLFVSSER